MGRGSGIVTAHGVFAKRRKELEEQALRRRRQDQDLYRTLLGQGYTPPQGFLPSGWEAPQQEDMSEVGRKLSIIMGQGGMKQPDPFIEKGPGEDVTLSPPSTQTTPDISAKFGDITVKKPGRSAMDVEREYKRFKTHQEEISKVRSYLKNGTTIEGKINGKTATQMIPPPATLEDAMKQLEEWGLNPYTYRDELKHLPRQTEVWGKRPSEYKGFREKMTDVSARTIGAVRDMPLVTAAPFAISKRRVPFAGPEGGYGFKAGDLGYGYEGKPEAAMHYKQLEGNVNLYSPDNENWFVLKGPYSREKVLMRELKGMPIVSPDRGKNWYNADTGEKLKRTAR